MLPDIFLERAKKAPDAAAVVQGRRRVTYGELALRTSRLASFLLRSGLEAGDRVGILCENSPEYVCAWFGVQRAGGVAVDINHLNSTHEIGKLLTHSRAKALIADDKLVNAAGRAVSESTFLKQIIAVEKGPGKAASMPAAGHEGVRSASWMTLEDAVRQGDGAGAFPEIRGGDIASIVYTSGTTGEPKGVMLTHDNFLANAQSIIDYLRLSEQDKVMVVLPFCYSYGKSLLTTHLMAGGGVVLENSFTFPTVVFNKMVEEETTGFAGVPSTFALMLNKSNVRSYRFPKLRYVTQAGGPMSPRHAEELARALPGTDIYIMYGQTEATARLTYLEPQDLSRRSGSIGKAIPGVTIELVKDSGEPAAPGEEGEIVATGRNVMAGYFNDPEATKKAIRGGRLHTGDLARMDENGYLYIVGRRSDMIKSGAHRISPKEIEEVILGMDQVHEAAVVGVEDEILGEAIRAIVVLKEGASLDARQVQRHCHARLAAFKIPKEVVFAGQLPRTHTGKVRRHQLKDIQEVAAP